MVRYLTFACAILAIAVAQGAPLTVAPATNLGMLRPIGKVSERFQSYNIEMAEVVGAPFWKPYSKHQAPAHAHAPAGGNPMARLFEKQKPIDLSNPRLRTLAAALGPAYVRVSGTWANSAYFQNNDAPALRKPPSGFRSVLTRAEWRGVVDFAKAANAHLVTSFAISPGVRNRAGEWTPVQARALIDYTHSLGGRIYAAELFNEPNLPELGAAPAGYDAQWFAGDEARFRKFIASASPSTRIAGPGYSVVGTGRFKSPMPQIPARQLLTAMHGAQFQIFSYHFYAAVSPRCAPPSSPERSTPADAISKSWLRVTGQTFRAQEQLRNRFAPRAPIWITETGDAACGGNPWADTFLDSFRYLNQLALLSQDGADAVFHNTLVGSDYGLLDRKTYAPRPNYWAALIWRRLMGRIVLDPPHATGNVTLYAHCLRDHPGGVALLALNLGGGTTRLTLSARPEVYLLTSPAANLRSRVVLLNGRALSLGSGDRLPALRAPESASASVRLPGHSIAFLAVPQAGNGSCS